MREITIELVASDNQLSVGNMYNALCLERFFERFRGLKAFQDDTAFGEDLVVFNYCNSVHTYGMKRAIDIAFADNDGQVVASYQNVSPKRIKYVSRATYVLERFSCPSPWFHVGEYISIIKNPPQ